MTQEERDALFDEFVRGLSRIHVDNMLAYLHRLEAAEQMIRELRAQIAQLPVLKVE